MLSVERIILMADEATAVIGPILEKTPDQIWQGLSANSQLIASAIALYGIDVSLKDIQEMVSTAPADQIEQLNVAAAILDLQSQGVLVRETDSGIAKKIVQNYESKTDHKKLDTYSKEREYSQYLKAKSDLDWYGNDDWSSPTFKLARNFEEFVLQQI